MRVYLALVLVAAVGWTVWTITSASTAPSGAQVRAVCARHAGVASVQARPILGEEVIVCRDGWAGYR